MRLSSLLIVLLVSSPLSSAADVPVEETARRLVSDNLVVDTHIDVPNRIEEKWEDVTRATEGGDFDLPRARKGGLDVPFMSIYIPASMQETGGSFQLANQLIDSVEAMVARAPKGFAMAHSSADVEANHEAGRISLAMGIENGAPIEGKLENLRHFHQRGVRYVTLAHSKSNHLSDSSYDENRQWNGLSDFGREVVAEMNRLGMMIDVSHLSDAAAAQAIELSKAPVIASHSSARKFTPGWERNMSDDLIKALAARGGVIQINFGSGFISQKAKAWWDEMDAARQIFMDEKGVDQEHELVADFIAAYREEKPYPYADVKDVADHFDHVIALVGVDHVGIGSDYDGVGDSLPEGLKDVASYPNLVAELLRRGYAEADIVKILGGNLMRVWMAVEQYAAQTH